MFWLPAESAFKYAVVASRKTIGIAVKRNRAKRLLRELVRAVIISRAEAAGLPKGNLVLVARSALLEKKCDSLKTELEQCLKNWPSA